MRKRIIPSKRKTASTEAAHLRQDIRKAFGFNMYEFSDILGVQLATLYRWEAGVLMSSGIYREIYKRLEVLVDRISADEIIRIGAGVKARLHATDGLTALSQLLVEILRLESLQPAKQRAAPHHAAKGVAP